MAGARTGSIADTTAVRSGVDPPVDRGTDRRARGALWALVGVAAAVLLFENRHLWFGGDDWYILLDRGITSGPGHLGLFEPHNEHWSTLPILAFRALYSVFGVAHYWPYVLLLVVVHLAIVVLLWSVMVRSGVDAWVALAAGAVFALLGIGAENLTAVWQVQLIAPLAFGLAALLVVPVRGGFTVRDGVAAALMTAAMMCSGVALPMLAVVALVAPVRRGWRVAVATAFVPAVVYAIWYAGYGHDAQVADPAPGAAPDFVWRGLTHAVGGVVRLEALGTVVVLAVAVWAVWKLAQRPFDPDLLVPGSLALGGVLFLALTGWRRGNIPGVDPAGSRYAYVTVAFVLPLIALAGQSLFRGATWKRVALAVIAVVVVGAQVRVLDHAVTDAEPGKRSDRGAFLATAALARQGRTFLLRNPLYAFEPQVTVAKIVAMDRDGKLPSLDGHGWDRGDELTVLGRLNLLVAPTSLVPDAGAKPVRFGTVRRATVAEVPGRPECRRIDARDHAEATLLGTGPSSLRVRGDGPIGVFLRDPARSAEGEPVYFTLDPEADLVLSIGRIDGVLVTSLPPGATTLCGLA